MSSLTTHFGLGTETAIIKVVIKWPSGIVDEILNPNINETLNVIEGNFLDVADYSIDSKLIYPNPTTDFIHVSDINLSNASVLIFDINGKKIHNYAIENNRINVTKLASGTYFLNIQEGKKSFKNKFIKQ